MKRMLLAILVLVNTGISCASQVLPPAEYHPGQLIVKTRENPVILQSTNTRTASSVIGAYHGTVRASYKAATDEVGIQSCAQDSCLQLVEFTSECELSEIKRQLDSAVDVEYAEYNYVVYTSEVGTGDEAITQPQDATHLRLSFAEIQNAGSKPVVAVVDTGVDYTHPDLEASVWRNAGEVPGNGIDDDGNGFIDDYYGYDFYRYSDGKGDSDPQDEYGHGTHVAGVVLQAAYNVTIGGAAGGARIMPLKFLDERGRGLQFDAAMAIYYAVDNGAQVINCSWGYFSYTRALQEAIVYARSRGVFVVASAGNNDWDITQYPAAFPEVVAVSALDSSDHKAFFSNFGSYIDIAAPGINIFSAYPGNSYRYLSGTSQAAPYIAGTIALLLCNAPDISYDDLCAGLYINAIDITDPLDDGSSLRGWDKYTGYGKADSEQALAALTAAGTGGISELAVTGSPVALTGVLNYPNPASGSTRFGYMLEGQNADVTIRVFDLFGREVRSFFYPMQLAGSYYKTPVWDLCDSSGAPLSNGTYFYVVTARAADGETSLKRQKLAILN